MHAPDELGWRKIAQRAVRSDRVVVLPPGLNEAPRLFEGGEPMLVQTLVPKPTIEALDIAVLGRLARVDEVRLDPRAIPPGPHGTPRELRPVVDGDRLGQAV